MKKVLLNNKWLMPIFWQVFLGFYFIKFFVSPLPFAGMWISLAALVVYLYAYFTGYYANDNKKLIAASIMVVCGTIAAPYNWGASVFFQYAALFIGLSTTPLKSILLLMALIILLFLLSNHHDLPIVSFLLPAVMISFALGVFGIFERNNIVNEIKIKEKEAEIKRLDALAERERISRDLHDVLGHTLTVISLKLKVANKMLINRDFKAVEKEITHLDEITMQATNSLQEIVTNYKSISLETEISNLILVLKQLNFSIESNIDIENLSFSTLEKSLSLIIRESITNVIRHANANHCIIELILKDGMLFYSIHDNGNDEKNIEFGNGLNGMKNRVKQLNGTMRIEYNHGIHLTVTIPIKEDES